MWACAPPDHFRPKQMTCRLSSRGVSHTAHLQWLVYQPPLSSFSGSCPGIREAPHSSSASPQVHRQSPRRTPGSKGASASEATASVATWPAWGKGVRAHLPLSNPCMGRAVVASMVVSYAISLGLQGAIEEDSWHQIDQRCVLPDACSTTSAGHRATPPGVVPMPHE